MNGETSFRWRLGTCTLYAFALTINGILSLERIFDRPGFLAPLSASSPIFIVFLGALLGFFVSLLHAPRRQWLYVTALLVPIEVSVPISVFPKLSPVDYVSAMAFFALLAQDGVRQFIRKILAAFPSKSLFFWAAFLIWAAATAILLQGNFRGMLRWGEFLFFFGLAAIIRDEQTDVNAVHRTLSNLFSLMAAFVSFCVILQFTASGGHAAEAHATFGHRNVMAAFLSLALPASSVMLANEEWFWNPIRRASSFLTLCAFVMSYSRGAWVGLTSGVLYIVTMLRQKRGLDVPELRNALLIVLMLIGPLGTLLILRNPERGIFDASQRPRYWVAAWHVLSAHPLTGLGPGNYERELPKYLPQSSVDLFEYERRAKHGLDFWQHLHNLYLQTAVEYGLVGLALWAAGMFFLIRAAYRAAMANPASLRPYFMMSIIAFLIHNLVDMMTVSSLDVIFAFLMGLTILPDAANKAPVSPP